MCRVAHCLIRCAGRFGSRPSRPRRTAGAAVDRRDSSSMALHAPPVPARLGARHRRPAVGAWLPQRAGRPPSTGIRHAALRPAGAARPAHRHRRRRRRRPQRRLQAAAGRPHAPRIFEGADRTGGRMFTATDLLGDGLTTELGGEFIDSNHEEMLALMNEFGLERLDTQAPEVGVAQGGNLLHQRPPLHAGAGGARVRAARQADPRGLRLARRGRRLQDRGRRHGVRPPVDHAVPRRHRRDRLDAGAARRRLRHRIRARMRRAVGAELPLPDRHRRSRRSPRRSRCSARATSATRCAAATSASSTSWPSGSSRRSSGAIGSRRSGARARASR